jgi:hypothetical protein
MKKLVILTAVLALALSSTAFAVSKKADMGPVGSCMRECVQTLNSSDNDVYATDISVDELTLDCVNYCNPNLKDGYCSPEGDGACCNVMYQETDSDCQSGPETCDLFGGGEQCQAGYTCVPCFTCTGHGLVGLCEPN